MQQGYAQPPQDYGYAQADQVSTIDPNYGYAQADQVSTIDP
jgi:hypothetical protein